MFSVANRPLTADQRPDFEGVPVVNSVDLGSCGSPDVMVVVVREVFFIWIVS